MASHTTIHCLRLCGGHTGSCPEHSEVLDICGLPFLSLFFFNVEFFFYVQNFTLGVQSTQYKDRSAVSSEGNMKHVVSYHIDPG